MNQAVLHALVDPQTSILALHPTKRKPEWANLLVDLLEQGAGSLDAEGVGHIRLLEDSGLDSNVLGLALSSGQDQIDMEDGVRLECELSGRLGRGWLQQNDLLAIQDATSHIVRQHTLHQIALERLRDFG